MIKFSRPLSITLYKRILPLDVVGAILLLNASLWNRDRKSNNFGRIDRYPFIRSNKTFWPCSQCWYSVKVGSAICPDWRLLSGRVLLCLDNQTCSKLLLQNLTDPNSDEHQHLIEALIGMEKVAEHINEMQRIHEEYGAIFDHLFRQHQKSSKQVRQRTEDTI